MPNATIVTARQKHVLPQRAIAEETEDEGLDADLSDDGDQGIDSMEYLLVLQQMRQKDLKASQASLKRQFTLDTAEFRGQVAALSEEMNAYIDKLEVDAENTEKVKWITTQGFADSAREWNMQRNSVNEARAIDLGDIQRKEEINEVSQLIERTATKRAQAQRRLLRKVRTDLEVIHQKEQVAS